MKKILLVTSLLLWPLNLFFSLKTESTTHLLGILILSATFVILTTRKNSWSVVPLVLLPFVSQKLFIIPLLYLIISLFINKQNRMALILLIVPLILSFVSYRNYFNQSIFKFDYEAQQLIERETKLYPTTFTARLFQNKARIKSDKFVNNFLALTDPNNYFFGFHPRQIVRDNLNIKKFPLVTIPFVLLFIIKRKNLSSEDKKILLFALISIVSLSTLSNFDRIDVILYAPLSFFIIKSINENFRDKWINKISIILVIFSLWEVIYSLAKFI